MITISAPSAHVQIRNALTERVGAARAEGILIAFRNQLEREILDAVPERHIDDLAERFGIESVTLTRTGFTVDVRRRTDRRRDYLLTDLDGLVLRAPLGASDLRRHRIVGLAERVRSSDPKATAA